MRLANNKEQFAATVMVELTKLSERMMQLQSRHVEQDMHRAQLLEQVACQVTPARRHTSMFVHNSRRSPCPQSRRLMGALNSELASFSIPLREEGKYCKVWSCNVGCHRQACRSTPSCDVF